MKHILKILLICGLALLSLPAVARADEMARDDFAAVSCGHSNTLALRHNGDLWVWGDDTLSDPQPYLILDNVATMAAGQTHSLAVKTDGSLWGWGSNGYCELGLDKHEPQAAPVKIMEDVAQVAAGDCFSLILKTDGTLWACGLNELGQLGNGGLGNESTPIQIMDRVKAIAAGRTHALAVKEDGSLWAWGDGAFLGYDGKADSEDDHRVVYQSVPVRIFESGVVSVSAGPALSLAVMEDGALWGWGDNGGNWLLEGEEEFIAAPKLLLEGVRQAEAGTVWVLAIKEDGSLWGWGENRDQALNFNYRADDLSAAPRKIYDNIADVSSGFNFTMAVKDDGTLWGWGNNDSGQLAQPPGAVGLPVRVQVEYPAWAEEPEPEPEEEPAPAEEPLPVEPDRPSPLPFIIGCGVLGAGGVAGGLVWRHKKRLGGVSKWRE